jgi:hypothetical protein
MNYTIKKYDPDYDGYRFEFNDKRWINIDLVNDYPNYHIINNQYSDPNWIYISDDEKKTLTTLNVLELRKISTKHKNVRVNNIVYSIATQSDYDKYSNKQYNNKLYMYLNNLWSKKTIKTTIV